MMAIWINSGWLFIIMQDLTIHVVSLACHEQLKCYNFLQDILKGKVRVTW